MVIICKNEDEIRDVLARGSCSGVSRGDSEASVLSVFDSSHNISQILKFIPFYERLVLRAVNSKWNLSFWFPDCWESIDYRFFDLKNYSFYLKNLRRFVFSTRRLDICIDQISDFFAFISSPVSVIVKSQCVDSKSSSKADLESNSSADTTDPLEPYSSDSSDSEFSFSNSDSNVDSSFFPFDSLPAPQQCHTSPSFSLDDALSDLKNTLRLLRNLDILQISDRRTRHNSVFTRVSPLVSSFVDSFGYSSPPLNYCNCHSNNCCNGDDCCTLNNRNNNSNNRCNKNNSNNDCTLNNTNSNSNNSNNCNNSDYCNYGNGYFVGPCSLIIDCPVNLSFILGLIPFSKNIVNLVISRIVDSNPNFSVCSIVSELIEHIPKNQLKCLQIGKTLPNYSYSDTVSLSPEGAQRRTNRINAASSLFGPSVELEEGDELIALLLANQASSLSVLVVSLLSHALQLDDVDLSFTAFNKIRNFKSLKHSRIPVWSGLDTFFPPNYSI